MMFADKIRNRRGELLYYVKGKSNGQDVWHCLLVEKNKLPLFENDIKTGNLDVADYGTILYSGFGVEVPMIVRDKIAADYGE